MQLPESSFHSRPHEFTLPSMSICQACRAACHGFTFALRSPSRCRRCSTCLWACASRHCTARLIRASRRSGQARLKSSQLIATVELEASSDRCLCCRLWSLARTPLLSVHAMAVGDPVACARAEPGTPSSLGSTGQGLAVDFVSSTFMAGSVKT